MNSREDRLTHLVEAVTRPPAADPRATSTAVRDPRSSTATSTAGKPPPPTPRQAGRDAATKALGADVARLSKLFGEERSTRSGDYMADARLRAAYLAFFLPQYAAKVAALLAQARDDGLLALPAKPRVLDVGAGPLTGILGAWLHAGALGPSVALDLAASAMAAGKRVLDEVAPGTPLSLVVEGVQRRPLPRGDFDLVIVAHVLNELGDPRRALPMRVELVRDLVRVLAPGGRVLVVEPGTRVHGRALMAVRDAVALDRGVAVLSPCRDAPYCPLLRTAGDWCHGELAWEAPPAFRALEQASGLTKSVLKQSHLLLARADDAGPPSDGLRLVGGLMTGRDGVQRRYGCGKDALVELVGRPRLSSSAAAPLRGSLLRTVEDEVVKPSRDRSAPAAPRGAAPGARGSRGRGGRRPR